MKIAVRYQSRGGNTKAVAEILAESFNTEALTVNNPISEYTEILFLGGGVYGGKMDNSLRNFIMQLSPDKVGRIVAFSTTGSMDSTIRQIQKEANAKGISVSEQELLIKMLLRGHSALGLKGGNLSEKQQQKVYDFIHTLRGFCPVR